MRHSRINKALKTWINRHRHRRGFGVHSPYAFSFISNVVRSKYSYYSTSRLMSETRKLPRRLRRECRLIFHIAARYNFSEVVIATPVGAQMRAAILLASRNVKIMTDRRFDSTSPCLIVAEANEVVNLLSDSELRPGDILFVRNVKSNPEVRSYLSITMPGGWLLADKDALLAVPSTATALNCIDVKLV